MENALINRLFALRDEKYRAFQLPLIPWMDAERVIGVRTPELKRIAKELKKDGQADGFLASLPHRYFEENQLHAFILSLEKDFDKALSGTDVFLSYVDNWATCDQTSPAVFAKNAERLLPYIEKWLASGETYRTRFAVLCLMRYFLDGRFKPEYNDKVASLPHGEYYVDMVRAWYFATALAKQYESTLSVLKERRLDVFTHNKTIRKACESFRVPDERKNELKKLVLKSIDK